MVSDVSSHWRNRKPRHPKAASQLYEFDFANFRRKRVKTQKALSIIWTMHSSLVPGCFPLPGDCFSQSLRYKCVPCPQRLSPAEKELPSFKSTIEHVKRSVQESTSLKLLTFWRMKEASNLQGSSLTGAKKK